jgi:hypothetical protein
MEMSTWTKSNYCESNACLEVQRINGVVNIRNSTQPNTIVSFTTDEWNTFLGPMDQSYYHAA